jgi:Ala-tRNA(Pro) deacylase
MVQALISMPECYSLPMKDNKVIALLDSLNISYRLEEHPAVYTVAESMNHLVDKRPIKNLVLKEKGKGRKFMIIMDGLKRLDLKRLAQQLDAKKLSFASANMLMETLGITPGSVSIFSLLNNTAKDIEVVIDESLLQEAELGFHPNHNTATIFIPAQAMASIINSTGHLHHLISMDSEN